MTKPYPPRYCTPLTNLVALLGLLLLSTVAWTAPEAIGTLAEAQGRVEINGAPTSAGAELRLGMRVVTGADGRAVLKFLDGQTVNLNPSSVFWIKNYRYAKDKPQDNRSSLELLKGGMRFISGAMSKESPEAIRIDTPVATLGIRGTEFTAVLGSLCLMVHSGAVVVTAAGKTLVANANQIVFVADANTPPRLVPAPELRAPCAPPREAGGAAPPAAVIAGCACRSLLTTAATGAGATSSTTAGTGVGA
ncbi:MAG TPA: FecR family protein, partial [Candidatus Competibacter phosphatis]|nr:FecR family protein [Candidatus Competibacter phosphatis]